MTNSFRRAGCLAARSSRYQPAVSGPGMSITRDVIAGPGQADALGKNGQVPVLVVDSVPELLAGLRAAGAGRGDAVGLTLVAGRGLGLAVAGAEWALVAADPAAAVA